MKEKTIKATTKVVADQLWVVNEDKIIATTSNDNYPSPSPAFTKLYYKLPKGKLDIVYVKMYNDNTPVLKNGCIIIKKPDTENPIKLYTEREVKEMLSIACSLLSTGGTLQECVKKLFS